MSGASSNTAAWYALLEPATVEPPALRRQDDPRLGEVIERWDGNLAALRPGRAVIVGYPQDEGVRRNGGRAGAAQAPRDIRRCLHRLTPFDAERHIDLAANPPLDAGDVRITGSLEVTQDALGEVVSGILKSEGVPVILGGGHETAFGHYLGYVKAELPVAVLNLDAHLDVRPLIDGQGHSGSPFRQAMEHPQRPLPKGHYACVGANPFAVARNHLSFAQDHGASIWWSRGSRSGLAEYFPAALAGLGNFNCCVYLSVDADVVTASEVPGVSAPNPWGASGAVVANCAFQAGTVRKVSSFDVVEINPLLDRDSQSSRWAAVTVWHFLTGLGKRPRD
jgi:formiminoglutamase